MRIIGLGHYSRVGKDTFANALLERIDPKIKTVKQSFAWKLKQATHELYAWAGLRSPEFYETAAGAEKRKEILPKLGKTPVELWVDFGTKAVRNNVYDKTWVDYLLKSDLGADILIIPDVRFPNEAEAIKVAGGTLIKIVRTGFGPLDTVADRALVGWDGWDYVLGRGGLQELSFQAGLWAKCLEAGCLPPKQPDDARQAALAVEVL